jgi:oxaloacetate decarboxylase gamma subunit
MALSEMLTSGVELMVLGMGMVYLFLAMLILVMQGMSRLSARLAPESIDSDAPQPVPVRSAANDPRLIAAISAAVGRYRAARKG